MVVFINEKNGEKEHGILKFPAELEIFMVEGFGAVFL